LAQSFGDLELVISDNCSTDATVELVRRYTDPRIRLLESDRNVGAIGNWNRVRVEARGRYVKLLAHDDVLYPSCLERQVAPMEHDDDSVLVAGRRDVVDDAGRVLIAGRGLPGMSGRYRGLDTLRSIVRTGTNLIGEPPFSLIRRDALERCKPLSDERPYLVDVDLWCHLLQLGDLFALPETVGAFRVRLQSESVGAARTQGAQARSLYRTLHEELPGVVSSFDVLVGSLRAAWLAQMRRLLYSFMRLRARVFSPQRS